MIPKVGQYGGFGKSVVDKMTRRLFGERAIFFQQKFDRRGLGRRKMKISYSGFLTGRWRAGMEG